MIADRGCDADRVIEPIERQGPGAVIPPRSHRSTRPRSFDAVRCRERHRVEFFFSRLKQLRRLAARYEKTARNYIAMVPIEYLRIWTRFEGAP